jgi:sn-glycerol 3-phosphate transport system ATP-binding protein
LDIIPTQMPGAWSLRADTVELLGAERLVHARLGDEILTLRLDESVLPPQAGQNFWATPRADRLHWFDVQTQKRIA